MLEGWQGGEYETEGGDDHKEAGHDCYNLEIFYSRTPMDLTGYYLPWPHRSDEDFQTNSRGVSVSWRRILFQNPPPSPPELKWSGSLFIFLWEINNM